MKEKITYALWAVLYVLCAGLGFVQNAAGFGKFLLVFLSLLFFLPGGLLLYWGQRKAVRIISLCSLGITLILLVLSFLTVRASLFVGDLIYALLVVFSSPMACSQYWVLSLFLWACLLMASFLKPRKL